MRRQRIIVTLAVLLVMVMAGCHTKEKAARKGPFLFYINEEGTALKREPYTIQEKDPKRAVTELIQKLQRVKEPVGKQAAIPQGIEVRSFELEDGRLRLHLNEEYLKLDVVKETLCRAAVVQTLTQIKEVDQVEIQIGNEPLRTKNGEPVGLMGADAFVCDTGNNLKSYHNTELTVFFANETGDGLVTEKMKVRYPTNVSMEKIVLEQLRKEPATKGAQKILSPQVKILNISVKDGICYVNFDKEFLRQEVRAEPKVVIYGIVNSLISSGNVSRVQISVDGESTVKYKETISLNEPFDRNAELAEQK